MAGKIQCLLTVPYLFQKALQQRGELRLELASLPVEMQRNITLLRDFVPEAISDDWGFCNLGLCPAEKVN